MGISNRFQHGLRSLRPPSSRDPRRSKLVIPHQRRRLEGGTKCDYQSVALRAEPMSLSVATAKPDQRSNVLLQEGNVQVRSTSRLAAWQEIVVAAYIEKHIAGPITVRALAQFVYLSSSCFRSGFKHSFGVSPHRYLVQQRIDRAKALLLAPKWSIAEITLALGFSQTSSFSTAFRKITGTTPIEYRVNQQ